MSYMSMDIPMQRGHYVYRFWLGSECLYVGSVGATKRGPAMLMARIGMHWTRRAPWTLEADRFDWASFSSSADALAEERRQILTQNPRYNIQLRRLCRKGLHDTSVPGNRTSDGKCKECTNARMRIQQPAWRKANPPDWKKQTAKYRAKLGEEEFKRRRNEWARKYRERNRAQSQ